MRLLSVLTFYISRRVTQGKVTGIIYPPADIRTIVDKTAQFVSRNGREFEARICGNETNSTKFAYSKLLVMECQQQATCDGIVIEHLN